MCYLTGDLELFWNKSGKTKQIQSWETEKKSKAMKRLGHHLHRSCPWRPWEGRRPAERPLGMAGTGRWAPKLLAHREHWAGAAHTGRGDHLRKGSRWQPPANTSSSQYAAGKRKAQLPGTWGGEALRAIAGPLTGTAIWEDLDKLEEIQRRVKEQWWEHVSCTEEVLNSRKSPFSMTKPGCSVQPPSEI